MIAEPLRRAVDAVGISASTLCAAHCLGMSLLFASYPTLRLSRRFHQEWGALLYWSELVLAAMGIAVALAMAIWGLLRARRWFTPLLLLVGSVGLYVGVFTRVHAMHPWGLRTVLGSGMLLFCAHLLNLRPCRSAAAGPPPH